METTDTSRIAGQMRELMRDIDDYLAELDETGPAPRPCYCGTRIYAHEPHCTGPSPEHAAAAS
jgi:hypothetical protein